jgi:hypothetical protein
VTSISLSFDYRCPFAKNLHLHAIEALRAGVDLEIAFVPWTLSQGHRAEGAPDVWDDPDQDSHHLSMAAGISVRDHQPERFLDAHEALFLARHVDGLRLHTPEEIRSALEPVGVDVDAVLADVASRRPHKVIAESYREFERYEAFGVPTLVVEDQAVFVRYMDAPAGDRAASTRLMKSLVEMTAHQHALNEFKHTQIPA